MICTQNQTHSSNATKKRKKIAITREAVHSDLPFMSWLLARVQFGTHVIAPPGATIIGPSAPSAVGPHDDHVYEVSYLCSGGGGGGTRRRMRMRVEHASLHI